MEYTVKKLGNLAGVSTRTLRYYDEIGILKPARINSSGYRIYGQAEVDRLQQILFYRELGVSLDNIKEIVINPSFDGATALMEHRKKLLAKREQLDYLIANVEKTIAFNEGSIKMSDKEKFEGFKKKMIDDNDEKYGSETRKKFGADIVDASNKKLRNMTEKQYEELEALSNSVIETLNEAYATGNPSGELAQKAAGLHHKWLTYMWDGYSKEAHVNLAQMYVDDERFRQYYDKNQSGTAEFLREAILIYTGLKN